VSALFASGRVVDLILVFMALEAALLAWHRRRSGRGPSVAGLLAFFLAGACLLLALRAALVGASWGWVAAPLAGAGAAHAADLALRWRRR
jgi:dolichol kinase